MLLPDSFFLYPSIQGGLKTGRFETMNAASNALLGAKTPDPWSRTIAAIEWAERTGNLFEFSDEIEKALEEDYFQNPFLYTENVLGALGAHYQISQNAIGIPPEHILTFVRNASQVKVK